MLNQCILVGRLKNSPILTKQENGSMKTTILLEIQRPYKVEGLEESESDTIEVVLWSGIAESTVTYCKQGSVIGVKARLVEKTSQCSDGKVFRYCEILAEKITFISSKGTENE